MITKSSNVEIHLQAGPCTSPPYNQFDMICNSCAEEQPCSFMGLRGFEISTIDGSLVYGPYFPETKKNDLLHSSRSLRFNGKPYSPGAKKYALNQIRSTLRKVLERQKDARSYYNNKAVQRDHTEGYRHLCDTCSTTIFNKHYVCASCAMEICIECYDDLQNMTEGIHTHPKSTNNKHARAEFVLFSKFAKKSISTLLKSTIPKAARSLMRKVKKENDPSAAAMVTTSHDTISTGKIIMLPISLDFILINHFIFKKQVINPSQQSSLSTSSLSHLFSGVKDEQRTSQDGQQFLKIEACNLNLDLFQQHWQTHRPIHVTNSTGNSEFEWTPAMFSTLCGTDTIQATDYDNSVFELNGKDYFDAFSDRKRRQRLCKKLGSSEVLKVKDWPQTQDLQNRLPGLYDDFMRTVPAPEYCSASGYLNLANRLPEEYLPPDLGPKMFISYGSDQHGKTGKTNLHCDITDAVNVMYYADDETARDKPKAASVWHIFPHDQIGQLQEYIRQYKDCDHLHPIFDHAFYLTEQDLVRLEAEFGVVPYTVYQNPGDAVFIPAGCAHQVLNCSNSIKCAFDFLSPENVESSLFISSELRKLHKQDALQVQTTLAFSWVSLKSD
ncbi:uncharacterized protein EV154DRAFT_472170 [Mucor mucedo]|uniref:uncharacterized protein n=1 Tax=Mucor mucedo TaxID=29922 RepID=UPI0022205FE3|nr:uncharacterized protein EV154DRAFT_472170 [Mucor mucedo]KAI7877879.1 hypothetical protein EV154DRAFT_472170 [Mucor mucedo]